MMDDNSIDYTQLVSSDLFKIEYAQMSNDLKKVDLDLLLNEDEAVNDHNLLAFFISNYFQTFLYLNIKYKLFKNLQTFTMHLRFTQSLI